MAPLRWWNIGNLEEDISSGERTRRAWQATEELKLPHYFNRPNYPQGNVRIERSFRTDEEEFYQVEDLPADLDGLEAALLAWNQVCEQVRPHQALGYKTPEQFYQDWLKNRYTRQEVLSDMY